MQALPNPNILQALLHVLSTLIGGRDTEARIELAKRFSACIQIRKHIHACLHMPTRSDVQHASNGCTTRAQFGPHMHHLFLLWQGQRGRDVEVLELAKGQLLS